MTDKELTLALFMFIDNNKVSKNDLMNLFNISKENAEVVIQELIERKAIYNFDMDKDGMDIKIISFDEGDVLLKYSNEGYCVLNKNVSVDGKLQNIRNQKIDEILDETLKQKALEFSKNNKVGIVIFQKKFQLGYSKASCLYNWIKQQNNGN